MKKENIKIKDSKNLQSMVEDPQITIRKAVRKSTVISLVMIAATAVAVFFIIQQINTKAESLNTKQNLIFLTNQRAKNNSELMRQWEEISPNLDKINNALPASSNLLGYMGELEKIASDTGVTQNVKMQSLPTGSLSAANATAKGGSVDYTIELKGSFAQFDDYLQRLENAPYYTQISSVSYTGSGNDTVNTAVIGAKIYTFGN